MTLTLDRIQRAREAGYDDEKIIDSIERRDPSFGSRIKKAREAGYDNQAIMQSIEKKLQLNAPRQSSPEFPDKSISSSQLPQQSSQVQASEDSLVPSATSPKTPASLLLSQESQSSKSPSFTDWIMQEPGEDAYEKSIRPQEISKEQLKKMSVSERLAYAQDINRHMEYQRSKGLGKGIAAGLTFGLSEKIPALKPKEGEHGAWFGEFLGSILPIEGVAKIVGYPLLKLAGSSPKYKAGLEAFSRMAGLEPLFQLVGHEPVTKAAIMGATGAAYEGLKEGIKTGEMPTPEDLTKHAAEWAAFDAILQSFGLAGKFAKLAREAKGSVTERINEVISKVNLKENNREALKKDIESALKEVFPERASLSSEEVKQAKNEASRLVEELPQGNRKNLAEKAIERNKVRTPEQLEEFLERYDELFPGISGNVKDKNRKFMNKLTDKNAMERKFDISEGKGENIPIPKMSEQEKLTRARIELQEAKRVKDKEAIKEAQKKFDLQKRKISRQESQAAKDKNQVELQVKASQEKKPSEMAPEPEKIEPEKKVESVAELEQEKATSDITPAHTGAVEKNIQSIERQIEKAQKKGDSSKVKALQKNLAIQKKKLKKPAVPIIETTGKSADQQIDIPKTFSERFVEGVNTTVDAIKNPGRTLSNTGRAINENLFNFLAPIERLETKIPVQDQVTSRIKLAQSSTSTINSVIENGIFSDIGHRVESGGLKEAYGDYTWSRLTRKMKKPENYSIQEIDAYRTSKQALKRQREGKKTGIGTKEANETVSLLGPKYEKIDAQIREYNKAVTSRFGKDLLGKELIDQWNNDYHSSMYRLMDSGEGSMLANGSLEPKQGFFRFKGSERKILPTSESDVYNTALLIQNSKKNDAVLQYKRNIEKGLLPGKIVKAEVPKMPKSVAEKIELPKDLSKVGDTLYGQTRADAFTPGKNRLRGWENGKAFEIEVPSEIVEVFKGMQPLQQHQLSKILTSVNRSFSRGLTLSPRKFFSIFARDALSAMIYSKSGVTPIDTARATADILGDSQLYKQFKFEGGDVYATRLASRIDRAQKIEDLVTPGSKGPIVPLNKIYGYLKKYEKTLGNISTAVPFAEYKAGIAKYGDTAEGRILAMMDAKRVTYDPSRKGKSILVRETAPFINFWNVTLQDISMLGSQLKRPEVWAKGLSIITMPSLALKMWNDGNPKYDDLTALDKAAFWHLFFGDHHIRIPTPWLLGTTFKTVPETLFDLVKGNGKEGGKALYHNAVDQISGNFNPLIQTSIELMTGKSPASPLGALLGVESKAPEVVPRRLQSLPKELQYTSSTSQVSRKLAPLINVSPVIMDRVLNNLGATLSRDALALVDEIAYQTGMAEDNRPDRQLTNYLVLGNFVSNSPASRTKYAEEFYEKLEALRVGKAGEKHGVPAKDIKKLEKAGLNKYNAEISKKFTKYRQLQESNLSGQVKKKELDKVQNEINALYKEAVLKARG